MGSVNRNFGSIMVAVLAAAGAIGGMPARGAEALKSTVAVDVNGKKLTFAELEDEVDRLIAAQKVPAAQIEAARKYFKDRLAEQFVMKAVILAEAKKTGVKVTEADRQDAEAELIRQTSRHADGPKSIEEFIKKHPLGEARARQELEDSILIRKLVEQEVASKVQIDEKAVDDAYAGIVSRYEAQVQSARDALPKILDIRKRLDGLEGEALKKKFEELAKTYSDCPSKAKGGDLGEFTAKHMVPEFSEVAFRLEPFTVSEPVKTSFGYHLIMVTKKIPAVEAKGDKPPAPEKVQASHILVKVDSPRGEPTTREQIAGEFKKKEVQKAAQKYFQELRRAARIVAPSFPELVGSAPPAPPPAPAPKAAEKPKARKWNGGATYTVKEGDDLVSIAMTVGVSPSQLMLVNGIKPEELRDALKPGRVLKLVGPAKPIDAAEAPKPDAGSPLVRPLPKTSGATYTVKEGDDIISVSIECEVPPSQLLDVNGLKSGDVLKPGQVLRLPEGAKPPAR